MKSNNERVYDILMKAKKLKNQRRAIRITAISTAILTVITSINLTLFLPFPKKPERLEQYTGSEYYSIIRTVDGLASDIPEEDDYKNNWQKWTGETGKGIKKGFNAVVSFFQKGFRKIFPIKNENIVLESAPSGAGSGSLLDSNGKYEEVTDNQVDGVIEGDVFKRTENYIFHLRGGLGTGESLSETYNENAQPGGNGYVLSVYSIEGATSKRVGMYVMNADAGMHFHTQNAEMYLSEDGNTVTVITPSYNDDNSMLYTAAISLNVANPTAISETNRVYVSGDYVTSRTVENQLLLVSNFQVRRNPDFEKPEQYLPQMGKMGALSSLPAADIYVPDTASLPQYTVVTTMDCATLSTSDAYAFLSYSESVYVSENNVFTTQSYSLEDQSGDEITRTAMTDISCISYADNSLQLLGTATVKGTVKNQYAMDEYEGKLRVFTSHQVSTHKEKKRGNNVSVTWMGDYLNANFYCVDLKNFVPVAAMEAFAPDGDSVQSVRFDGNKAYVCTAITRTLTDPVYAFDLSDLSNITYNDTGIIKGYSFALTKFKDDTLLGIGYNEERSLKVELYKETENSVQPLTSYEPIKFTTVSENYKSYLIDKENGYVGVYDVTHNEYIFLQYFSGEFIVLFRKPFLSDGNAVRSCIKDGFLYLLGSCGMQTIALS